MSDTDSTRKANKEVPDDYLWAANVAVAGDFKAMFASVKRGVVRL